jgi:hypothetical protein
MKRVFAVVFALGMVLSFAHCKKDDDNGNGNQNPMGKFHLLYDKWWYNESQFRGDHYFTPVDSVAGELEWVHHNQMVSKGNYQWYPTGDSMGVIIPGYAPLTFFFDYVQEDKMAYRPANEPENQYIFTTTKP